MQVAQQIASNPSASLPNQIEAWGDLKAAYNLFARDEVTFEAIARPHWELTKQRATGRNLVIGDTTELDFGKHRLIRMKLSDYLPQLELLGTYTLSLRARPNQPAREAQLEVGPQRVEPYSRSDRWTVLPGGRKAWRLPRPQERW